MATENKPTTKHTPGEWAFGEWDDEDGGGQHFTVDAFINKDAEPELVAIVAGEPDCMEANARLLAAAPDMLAALLTVRNEQAQDGDCFFCRPDMAPEQVAGGHVEDCPMPFVWAAIARAAGGDA